MKEEENQKLYVDKPKKAQQKQQTYSRASLLNSTAMNRRPHKESFARRYKFIWPMLLALNFSIGAYLLLMPRKINEVTEEVEESQATDANTSQVAENKKSNSHPVKEV